LNQGLGVSFEPHDFWQAFAAPGSFDPAPADGHIGFYPAPLADGRQLPLPLRVLPGDGKSAVASLILNQASFAVEDGLAAGLTELLEAFSPEIIIGVPTLGLPLASNVARRLGHTRMVPLGTSRKFWYRDELSEPMKSITSPTATKTLYVDPRMLPLLRGKRVAVIDDVISSGQSMGSVLRLLEKAEVEPVAIGCAMLQGTNWQEPLAAWRDRIVAPLKSPRFALNEKERWVPVT
jgi:adenine/guanine phosphoribosyltransferase-like PRPP-binding protein